MNRKSGDDSRSGHLERVGSAAHGLASDQRMQQVVAGRRQREPAGENTPVWGVRHLFIWWD